MLEAERYQAHLHLSPALISAKNSQKLASQPGGGIICGIDHNICLLPDWRHQSNFPVYRRLQGIAPLLKRMHPARFLVAIDDGPYIRLQKQQTAVILPLAKDGQDLKKLIEAVGGTYIIDQSNLVVAPAASSTEFRKFQDHACRHVIHNIKTHVLQERRSFALPSAGHTGNNQNFHFLSPPPAGSYGTFRTSGSRWTPV